MIYMCIPEFIEQVWVIALELCMSFQLSRYLVFCPGAGNDLASLST